MKVYANSEEISYVYRLDEYGNEKVEGFEYLGNNYIFEYDERDIISYICDEYGNRIVYYNCDDNGNIIGVYSVGQEGWEVNSDENFVGNINKIRWMGYEYDENIDCYLIGNRYYSVQEQKFTDGENNDFAYSYTNPFVTGNNEGIMLLDSYYSDLAAEEWSSELLEDSSFGIPITYSSGWYNSLSAVEIIARCIYCEGGTAYTDEGDAVAWVILNRTLDTSSRFPNEPYSVVVQGGEFASVIGTSAQTRDARIPDTDSSRWRNAAFLACLLLTTTDVSDWRAIANTPINGQLYFYSYTFACDHNGEPFSGSSSSSLYYDDDRITNVYVMGYGSVSSFNNLFANYNPVRYSRNIFYNLA